jgi:PAS domain S-box-containing protein
MAKEQSRQEQLNELRRRAEEALSGKKTAEPCTMPEEDVRALLHELQVHQIELEMQNEELRCANALVEEARNRYVDLYELAPVGYLTLDENGLILEANLTIARMLGVERSRLVGSPLSAYIVIADWYAFRSHLGNVLKDNTHQTCEVRFMKAGGGDFHALLDTIFITDAVSKRQLRISATDITDRKGTEDKLRESEQRFSRFFHASPVGTTITRLSDGQFAEANDAFLGLFGYTREEVIGQNSLELGKWANPEDRTKVVEILQKQGRIGNFETRFRKKSGEIIDVLLSAEIIEMAGEQYILNLVHDISARKLIEDTQAFLAQSGRIASGEEFFESLARYLGQSLGMDYVCIDRLEEDFLAARTLAVYFDGKFEDNVAYTLKDTPCGEVVEKKVCCFPKGVRHLFPRDEALQEMKAESYVGIILWGAKGQPIGLIAVIGRQPLANRHSAESVLQLVALRAAGELERKLVEEELRENQSRLDLAVRSAHMGVWDLDLKENKRRFDDQACHLMGASPGKFTGTEEEFYKAVHPDDREMLKAAWARTIERDVPYETEYRAVWPDGSVHHVIARAKLFRDETGQPVRFNGLIWDITDRKQMEDELRRSRTELESRVRQRTVELTDTVARLEQLNEELEEFAFVASHDLQEPLRKIQTFGNMLIKKHKDSLSSEGKDFMDRMTKSANRMSELLRALLNYSRTGASRLNHSLVSLTEVVQDAAGILEHRIKRAIGKVEIGELPVVEADAALMRQLFQNIIENSIKYRKESEPPVVKVSGSVSGSVCRISIEDNGIGFDEGYSQQIFKPFERLHGRNSPYSGTGMGLTICRKIVARHGGDITVSSMPGHGATFTVTIPLKQRAGT